MSRPWQIFLARCFAEYRINAQGRRDDHGMSNLEVGEWFRNEIMRIGGSRVRVVTTMNPTSRMISEQVKRSIDESDAAICIFPKRVECPYHGWTTSQYVLTESGYASSRFRHNTEKHLFGFVEEGVNRENLGLGFPADRAVPVFRRDHLPALIPQLTAVVQEILDGVPTPSDDPEPLLLKKQVYVRRDGRAAIETLYRFRVSKSTNVFRARHTIWRVRRPLPDFRRMLEATPGQNSDYFVCLPHFWPHAPSQQVEVQFEDIQYANHGKEVGFLLKLKGAVLEAGDIVEYRFAYSYPDAFFDSGELKVGEPNSAGLRTGGRGTVREAILDILFERNWNRGVALPSIDPEDNATGPIVATANETSFPSHVDPQKFWHSNTDGWQPAGQMKLLAENAGPLYEGYRWQRDNFTGLVKSTWQPTFNFHQPRKKSKGLGATPDDGDDKNLEA